MHQEYAPEGQTINKEYYLEILRCFRDAVRKKRSDMWTGKNWQLYHGNAPAYSAHAIKGFLARNNKALVKQPPYFSDLVPCDFWLFSKLKTTLKGTRFQSLKDIIKKRRRSSEAFQRRSLRGAFKSGRGAFKSGRGAFKSGRGAGKSVCTCNGSILEIINKICDIYCVVCFTPKGRILFEQTSYALLGNFRSCLGSIAGLLLRPHIRATVSTYITQALHMSQLHYVGINMQG